MKNRRARCQLAFLLLLFLLVILAALSFSVGSVSLSLRDMCEILSGADRESTAFHILWDIRLPRLFAAALLQALPTGHRKGAALPERPHRQVYGGVQRKNKL